MIAECPLVLTADGYFGIVVADHEIFAANGTQMILDDEAWQSLTILPLNLYQPKGPASSFVEMFENRTPAQQGHPPQPRLHSSSRSTLARVD
jgi:hypothetical protein